MRLLTCFLASINAYRFIPENFQALCHVTLDDQSALIDFNETELAEIGAFAGLVIPIKESIRRMDEDVEIGNLLYSADFTDAVYLDLITMIKDVFFKWDNNWCASGVEIFFSEEVDVASLRTFFFDIFADVSEASTRELEDMITSVAEFILSEVSFEDSADVLEYVLQPLAPLITGTDELPDLSGVKQIIDVFRERSTVPRNAYLDEYVDQICDGVNQQVKTFSTALKPPLEKFQCLYSKYFSGNFSTIDSIGKDFNTVWAFVRLIALHPDACDGLMGVLTSEEFVANLQDPAALTAQVIPMLQGIMTYEDSLELPADQTFETGVLSWLMYSARFNMMVKEFLPYLDSFARKNYIFGAIWEGFEGALGNNLGGTVDLLDQSARDIETALFCVIPDGENKTCDAVLEQKWEENGLPLDRDDSDPATCGASSVIFSTFVALLAFISFL